jgi:hypothetical protein
MLCGVKGEGGNVVGVSRVPDEAASSVSVESNHEKECEMVSVPKSLEALVADLVVSSGVNEEHDKKHEMPSDASCLGIMDIKSRFWAHL